jgi:hypothetical protein
MPTRKALRMKIRHPIFSELMNTRFFAAALATVIIYGPMARASQTIACEGGTPAGTIHAIFSLDSEDHGHLQLVQPDGVSDLSLRLDPEASRGTHAKFATEDLSESRKKKQEVTLFIVPKNVLGRSENSFKARFEDRSYAGTGLWAFLRRYLVRQKYTLTCSSSVVP